MSYDDDYWYYQQEAAAEQFIEESLRQIQEDQVCSYLGQYGDAIQERVDAAIKDASELVGAGYPGPSVVASASAIELIIRFLLLRPLVQGAFLSDEWAGVLAGRIATGRTSEDRTILPQIMARWGIDLSAVRTPSGLRVWQHTDVVWKQRNGVVHKGDRLPKEAAEVALECAITFLTGIVRPLAGKLGFTLHRTGKWSVSEVVDDKTGHVMGGARYETGSPFDS